MFMKTLQKVHRGDRVWLESRGMEIRHSLHRPQRSKFGASREGAKRNLTPSEGLIKHHNVRVQFIVRKHRSVREQILIEADDHQASSTTAELYHSLLEIA